MARRLARKLTWLGAMTRNDLVWKIAGEQGSGIETAGEVMAACLHRLGYWVFAYRSFMSLIKGGYTSFQVRAAPGPLGHHGDAAHVLVALTADAWQDGETGLAPDAVVLYAEEAGPPPSSDHRPAHPLPARELARQAGNPLARNMVALGASTAAIGLPLDDLLAVVEERFAAKGPQAVRQNALACRLGYQHASTLPLPARALPARRETAPDRLLLSGNEALALGAAVGGCRYFAAYPITPATEIFYRLQALLPALGGRVLQAEDELAAVCQAIGASFAGARAMTATSGPGFSLMQEAIGLAAMAEVPLVVVDVQRGGPSTGLPTRTEQSDLLQMAFGSHGDAPRLVLAPHSTLDCFYAAQEALHLADAYQCPVILASDLHLGMSLASVPFPDPVQLPLTRGRLAAPWPPAAPPPGENAPPEPGEGDAVGRRPRRPERFRRYALTPDGVSPRSFPGQPGLAYTALGNEHDEAGRETEDPEVRRAQAEKRQRKLAALADREDGLLTWEVGDAAWAAATGFYTGPASPDVVLVGWGSTGGCLAEARQRLAERGLAAGHLHLRLLWPFPARWVTRHLAPRCPVLVVEQNAGGHLERLLRLSLPARQAPTLFAHRRFDGRPLLPGEVEEAAVAVARTPAAVL